MIDNIAHFEYSLYGPLDYASNISSPGHILSLHLRSDDTFEVVVRLAMGKPDEERIVTLSFPAEYVRDIL